jgi:type IV pilus assembly protein PilM
LGLFAKEELVGVDVGSTAVRLVQLKKGMGNQRSLVSFGSAQIPEKIAQSDSKIDRQKVAQIIRQLVKTSHISSNKVVAALPASDVFTTVMKMPPMSAGELAKAAHYQAEQNIPLKIEDVKIDWQVVRENLATKETAIMIIAAPKTKIEKAMELMDMAGLDLTYLETTPIAVARALSKVSDPLVMIVDIGGSSTEISVVENGIVSHVRSVPAAGFSLTNVISKNLNLDEAQAEQFKRKFGLSQDKLEGQVFKTMKPVIETITDEIKRSLNYYQEQYGGNIQKIVVAGGSAHLIEFLSYLKTAFSVEVVFGNAWENVSYQPNVAEKLSQNALEFASAVGLAMREG